MQKFEVDKKYSMASVCDHNCVWTFEVIERTAKTVTLQQTGNHPEKPIQRRISIWDDCETVKPLGSYSMAPILTAKKKIKEAQKQEPNPSESQKPSNVIDFTARLKARQEQRETDEAIQKFKIEYLSYVTQKDADLLAAAPGEAEEKFVMMLICSRIDKEQGRA